MQTITVAIERSLVKDLFVNWNVKVLLERDLVWNLSIFKPQFGKFSEHQRISHWATTLNIVF